MMIRFYINNKVVTRMFAVLMAASVFTFLPTEAGAKKQKQLVIQFTLDTGKPFLMTSNMLRLAQEANKIINSRKF